MITAEFLDETRAALKTLGAYDAAAEWAMQGIARAAGLGLDWWTWSSFPMTWKETSQRVLYEERAAVPILCPVFCFTPHDGRTNMAPAPGRWMLAARHDVWQQRLGLEVLKVREGEATDWWSLWQPVQTRKVAAEQAADGAERVWGAGVGDCRLVWTTRHHGLGEFTGEADFRRVADRLASLAEGLGPN
jgi:hypothetical protein